MDGLTTGELARHGGVHLETIRFYERQGLLPKPPRTASGYRVFPKGTDHRVRFIKRGQELGFSLREIKELLAMRVGSGTTRREVRQRAKDKLRDIEQKIADLTRMQAVLTGLVDACPGDAATSDCPILDALETGDADVLRPMDAHAKPSARVSTKTRRQLE